ncbi:MAG: glycine--tRNA ligase subunit beta [Rhodospirillales bacterium CG15_BIG_FIL_POST_REV_8_21_14_020_66_15]|nr:MAG: glycine--tRNA ligase subunit beta [Rhodospirillales bacterium CG15_BIG_FIL_POST_REV_8_21_14_020_66_15]
MPELLLELLSEEIPARMQARAADDLKRLVGDGLKGAGLAFTNAQTYVTPRRLTLVVHGLPVKQPDISEERRGPRADAPEQAKQGFMKSLPKGAEVEERETEKGKFLFARVEQAGEKTRLILPGIIQTALQALPWPKSMRWGRGKARWVRPLHSILAVYDQEGLPVRFAGVEAGVTTRGHAFMAPGTIEVADFADYEKSLRAAKVVIDPDARKQTIGADAAKMCKGAGVTLKDDPALLDEVAGLVEWPVVLMGRIDAEFMDVPPEVLITSMRKHQKYFATEDAKGNLASRFILVANRETADGGRQAIAGNERVLRARLADAKFFWDQDRKTSLASKAPQLKERVFHAKLGTLDEKVDRMQALAVALCEYMPQADRDKVRSAARLAKADLSTGMVGEFPDLQGVMGAYYARHDGESEAVAAAVADHYSPLGPSDDCPSKPESVCVALADKIDSLVGFWAIDEKPTGSKDPYALRRAALGVIRLIIENKLRLPLYEVFRNAADQYKDVALKHWAESKSGETFDFVTPLRQSLLDFFADRLKVHLREQGVKHDHIDAVFALGGEDDLVRLLARVEALADFLGSDDGGNLLTAYRRAANILRIEEKKDGVSYAARPDDTLLTDDAEKTLYAALEEAAPAIADKVQAEDFTGAMAALAGLRAPVDAFFDKVTVNADDAKLRENRLKLLSMIRTALEGVADFSRIEG